MSLLQFHKSQLHQIFNAGIAAIQPSVLIRNWVSLENNILRIGEKEYTVGATFNRLFVIGAGKASAAMANELENILGDIIHDGIVITKYHHSLPNEKIKIEEAAHPIPDQQSVVATKKIIQLLSKLTERDIVICLWSGGASALMTDLPDDISLEDLKKINDLLIRSGADIREMNTVRKHLSVLKGGQLIRFCNHATIVSLIISDVPDDALSVIASGPTVADDSDFHMASDILNKINDIPVAIYERIKLGLSGGLKEMIHESDDLFKKVSNYIIANNKMARDAASAFARTLGYKVIMIDSIITGDTEMEAVKFVDRIVELKDQPKICLIQGGETTIQLKGKGKGGRNQHFALKAMHELKNRFKESSNTLQISLLSAGTDGTDGPTEAAGAIIQISSDTDLIEMNEFLIECDSYSFHKKYGNLLITGPTHTNVMDLMIALIN